MAEPEVSSGPARTDWTSAAAAVKAAKEVIATAKNPQMVLKLVAIELAHEAMELPPDLWV